MNNDDALETFWKNGLTYRAEETSMLDMQRRLLVELARAGAFRFQARGGEGFRGAHHDNKDGPVPIYSGAEPFPYFLSLRTPDNGETSGGNKDGGTKKGTVPRALIERAGRLQAVHLRNLKRGNPNLVTAIPHAGEPFADGFMAQAKAFGWRPSRLRFSKSPQRHFKATGEVPAMDIGDSLVIADDVVTLADVKIRFHRALPEGLTSTLVLLVDRDEGGMRILKELGIVAHSVFGLEDVLTVCEAEGLINASTVSADDIRAYAKRRRELVEVHLGEILKYLHQANAA